MNAYAVGEILESDLAVLFRISYGSIGELRVLGIAVDGIYSKAVDALSQPEFDRGLIDCLSTLLILPIVQTRRCESDILR